MLALRIVVLLKPCSPQMVCSSRFRSALKRSCSAQCTSQTSLQVLTQCALPARHSKRFVLRTESLSSAGYTPWLRLSSQMQPQAPRAALQQTALPAMAMSLAQLCCRAQCTIGRASRVWVPSLHSRTGACESDSMTGRS